MKYLVILALTLLAVLSTADAVAKDSLTLRVFNKNFKLSKAKILAKLETANLEGNGYEKEEIIKLTSKPGSIQQTYSKKYRFTKTVTCDKVMAIEQELNTLLGGAFGSGVATKLKKDIQKEQLTSSKSCKVGIEIHFGDQQVVQKRSDGHVHIKIVIIVKKKKAGSEVKLLPTRAASS